MTTKKTMKTMAKKATAKKATNSRPAPTETATFGQTTDGKCIPCDRTEALLDFHLSMGVALSLSKRDPQKNRNAIGQCLLDAAFYAMWHTASDLTISGDDRSSNPWDLLQAFSEALDRFRSKEVRTLGEAFGIPDHKGRIATYGPRRVIRDGWKVWREEAIFTDYLDLRRAGKASAVALVEVGKLHGIKAERVAQVLKLQRYLARNPFSSGDPKVDHEFDPDR
jgi:hypothetical protein